MVSEFDDLHEMSAIEELKKWNYEGALNLLRDIEKVEKIKPKIPGDDYFYRFYIMDRVLILPSSKMLTPLMFSRRYLEEFNVLPHEDVIKNWELIVNALKEEKLIVHIEDNEEDDESYAAETFLNIIRKLKILNKGERGQFELNNEVLFSHNGNYYLPSGMVKKVLDIARTRIKIQRLSQLISKYKIGAGTIRYGKESNETIRCWIFSLNLISDPLISITNNPVETQKNQGQDHEMVEY